MTDTAVSRLSELQKYPNFSNKVIKNLYCQDVDFRKLFTINNKYRVTVQNSIAFFDFSKEPLDKVYKSVILDFTYGLIKSKQTTNQIINTIFKDITAGGLVFQKIIKKKLGHRYLNTISLGHSMFFALNGYSNGNTNWVSFHFMKDYDYYYCDRKLRFETIKLNGYVFSITHEVKSYILDRLREGLYHNETVKKILTHHLNKHLACTIKPNKLFLCSLIFKNDLIAQDYNPKLWHVPNVVEYLADLYITKTHSSLMVELKIKIIEADFCFIRRIKRIRYNY